MAWGDGANWQENDATPRPRRHDNRETVQIVICPYCRSRHVRRRSVAGTMAFWCCETCDYRWKEPAEIGVNGKGQII